MNPYRLDGKSAVVTGAGRGLGREVALALAEMGAKVVVNDLGGSEKGAGSDSTIADQVVAEIEERGGVAIASYDSVAEHQTAKHIIDAAVRQFGSVDILVNNAAVSRRMPIWEADCETFRQVIEVDLMGTFHCSRHATPYMKDLGWGRIVNITSRSGIWGTAGTVAYGSAKGGQFGFTNAACRDLAPYGINMNAVVPGAMLTRMITRSAAEGHARGEAIVEAERFVRDAQDPADVAAVVAFLCTEESHATSGQLFFVKGGQIGLFSALEITKKAYHDGRWTVEELAWAIPRLGIPPMPSAYGG